MPVVFTLDPLPLSPTEDRWRQGPPAHLSAEDLSIDQRAYARLACAVCGRRAQDVRPEHQGRRYRLVCVCRRCGNTTIA